MESRIIKLYDYHDLDLSQFKTVFHPDEDRIQKEMKKKQVAKSVWEKGEEVHDGDMVVCELKSENPKFNRSSIQIAVGSNLFHKELEQKLVGAKKGAALEYVVDGAEVEVQIREVTNRVVPELNDALIQQLEIENVTTVEEYRTYLTEQQKRELLDKIVYPAIQFAIKEVIGKSDLLIKKQDWEDAIRMEMEKYRVLSEMDGFKLEEMTEKEFVGRIPVKSYYELLSLVQSNNWETVAEALIGQEFAKEEGYEPSNEEYEKSVREYSEFWHTSHEDARRIICYEYYVFSSYASLFYNRIRKFVEGYILE